MRVEEPIDRSNAKTAILYLRVSTKEQAEKGGRAEGFSIPAQREALHRKAQSMGAVIIAEFVDAGESAKSADRPNLQSMLDYLRVNPVDYVLVHKVDRLARNRVDDVAITMAIKKSGATLVSASENIDETPSGMLLHGIMSSIAEFYSRNLATEVHKGMSQKAKTGGTPGRAPLGYINIGRITPEGREERTVALDPERAELITWAFTAFATGEWTLRSLARELEARGLTTRRTPKQPARPVRPNVLHSILTNPYYKGEVIYRGVVHQGRHHPLTDPATWKNVQDVLVDHLVGEKQRDHPHYLKSSVFCGECESRLIVTNARNRHGTIYPYFVCLGRHQKRTNCTRKAMPLTKVERIVEDHWATIQLDPEHRKTLEESVRADLSRQRHEVTAERKQLTDARTTFMAKRQKLIEAIYSGAIPLDLIADEQKQITKDLATIEQRLAATTVTFDRIEANLSRVLNLMTDCYTVYLSADPSMRRLLNQALFTYLYIDEHGVHVEYAKPFDVLTPRTIATDDAPQASSVLKKVAISINEKKSPDAQRANEGFLESSRLFGGLKMTTLAALADSLLNPEGLKESTMAALADSLLNPEGLKESTMAALADSLLNPSESLSRVLAIIEKQPKARTQCSRYDTTKAIIAQTGARDPSVVRLNVKENRRLSAGEINQLVETYETGTLSQLALAHQFRISVETVNRHIRRHRQALRLGCFLVRHSRSSVWCGTKRYTRHTERR